MMSEEEKLSRLKDWIAEISFLNSNIPIIVEGKKDTLCLRKLGLKGKILQTHTGDSLYGFCEKINRSFSEVIVLTDWDERGNQIFYRLKEQLGGSALKFLYLREKLIKICGTEIQGIEELCNFLQRLRNSVNLDTQNKTTYNELKVKGKEEII